MPTKRFHIGDILSVTTGRLVSRTHISGVYDILGWMTGEELMTHQLPRASDESEDFLRQQFPDLAAIEAPNGLDSEEKVLVWLASIEAQHGSYRDVEPLAALDHTHIDPILELRLMRPDAEIIQIDL